MMSGHSCTCTLKESQQKRLLASFKLLLPHEAINLRAKLNSALLEIMQKGQVLHLSRGTEGGEQKKSTGRQEK